MDRCVEVVVRFAGTIVQIVRIAPGAECRVGRDRGADIALEVPAFTLVSSTERGFVMHDSRIGLDKDAPRDIATIPLEPDVPLTRAVGDHVTLTITLVTTSRIPVPRRRIERRPFWFGAASIAAHVGLLLAALWAASPEDDTVPANETTKRRPAKIARFAVAAQTIKREKAPPPLATPITTDTTPSPSPALDEPSGAAIRSLGSESPPNGRGPIKVAPAPDSTEILDETLANPRQFDPSTSPAFDTVKVGNYTTVSTGRAGGERYELAGANGNRKPLIVVSCDAASCLVIGGDAANGVRRALEGRLPDIVKCYADHAATAGKKVEVDFGIDESGKVEAVNVGGVGDYDSCVAEIVRSIQFADSTK